MKEAKKELKILNINYLYALGEWGQDSKNKMLKDKHETAKWVLAKVQEKYDTARARVPRALEELHGLRDKNFNSFF